MALNMSLRSRSTEGYWLVGEVKKEVEGEENFQLLAALRSFQRRQRFHPVIGLLVDPRNISLFFPQPKTDKTATQYRIVTSTTSNFREVVTHSGLRLRIRYQTP
jgi:hypothetical protein